MKKTLLLIIFIISTINITNNAIGLTLVELTKRANDGDAVSQNQLGLFYFNGSFVKKDLNAAREWFEKAAVQGYKDSIINMAQIYEKGIGVEKELLKAKEYYEQGVEQNDERAMWHLGELYQSGALSFMRQYKEAAKYFKMAASNGHLQAQNRIAYFYSEGKGVEQDYKKALYWYKKAANKGLVKAQFNLGIVYQRGEGVEISNEKAKYWYKKASTHDYTEAQMNLSDILYKEGNYVEALPLIRKVAVKGNKRAKDILSNMYFENRVGAPVDKHEEMNWYLKMAKDGDRDAQYKVAEIYRSMGYEEESIRWMNSSAAQGQPYAVAMMKSLSAFENQKAMRKKKYKEWIVQNDKMIKF